MNISPVNACAPGKLILSGEHSAVYGAPAIALAVNRYIRCQSSPLSTPELSWRMPDTGWQGRISFIELRQLSDRLDQRFELFEQDKLSAGQILEAPQQLALYALAQCLPADYSGPGVDLEIFSELPLGSGMGSSAALSAAITRIAQSIFSGTALQTTEQLFQRVRYCERLCHGRGGLIDAATVSYGGLVQVRHGAVNTQASALGDGWFYINSGSPIVGTGDCVDQVRRHYAESDIWHDFTAVTEGLMQAIACGENPIQLLRQNHRLLNTIGVVPEPVAEFIARLESLGGAAKISGAGAVAGNAGGALIAYAPQLDLSDLCHTAGYSFMAIEEDNAGARLC
ncbi:mevalonate kinase family protein [Amphritea balenae]|uniref:mevalonate kinase n=1 Tax=Amphritea balenae TaxID=452629 RepID=A0A3P1SM30_9GAMM|nr:mevalonate kinase [Amphritea balenae]RRC98196.1 mevalonate kinase [Amphritea balenae]GGK80025.1 mevalonate kinase [Amphritea balenae]